MIMCVGCIGPLLLSVHVIRKLEWGKAPPPAMTVLYALVDVLAHAFPRLHYGVDVNIAVLQILKNIGRCRRLRLGHFANRPAAGEKLGDQLRVLMSERHDRNRERLLVSSIFEHGGV